MFDKLMALTFRKAEKLHNERTLSRAKVLGISARMFVSAGKALITAHAERPDIVEAIDSAIGWERFIAAVNDADSLISDMHDDDLTEIVEHYPTIRKVVLPFLNAFRFRSWQADDPILSALDILREVHVSGQRSQRVCLGQGCHAVFFICAHSLRQCDKEKSRRV